jgi:hypothetical protein
LINFVRPGPISPEELDEAVRRFKKGIIERALGGELTHHLGFPAGGDKPHDTTNHRHGTGSKTVLADGSRDVLGLWMEQTEGAKFWMNVFSDLSTRGRQDTLIAVTDGLKGMPRRVDLLPQRAIPHSFGIRHSHSAFGTLIRHSAFPFGIRHSAFSFGIRHFHSAFRHSHSALVTRKFGTRHSPVGNGPAIA